MALLKVFSSLLSLAAVTSMAQQHSFGIDYDRNTFVLDGKPFRYVSGSIHYFRVHPALWNDRLTKVRAAGFNAVQIYVEWSLHEPSLGHFTFGGHANLDTFLHLAWDNGLFVVLRPGPFIDAERDFGGLPPWLLRDRDIKIRTSDKAYLDKVELWFDKLLPMLKPHLVQNGGPIIMVQVENEYGSYGTATNNCDLTYLVQLRDLIKRHLGNETLLFSTDGGSYEELRCSKIPGVYQTVDFGPGEGYQKNFNIMRKVEPRGPLVNSEYYPGWFDAWSVPHMTVNSSSVAADLDGMLHMGANVNVYLVHGGTSFGFKSGSNQNVGKQFENIVTSYDYDAPISEAGDLTEKYYVLKNVIKKYLRIPDIKVTNSTKVSYGDIAMWPLVTVFESLPYLSPKSVTNKIPLTFEEINQNYGIVLYETVIKNIYMKPAKLEVKGGVRDRAHVYVDDEFQGYLDRKGDISAVGIFVEKGQRLKILVENQERNYPNVCTYKTTQPKQNSKIMCESRKIEEDKAKEKSLWTGDNFRTMKLQTTKTNSGQCSNLVPHPRAASASARRCLTAKGSLGARSL
jgi:beta-galactosidase